MKSPRILALIALLSSTAFAANPAASAGNLTSDKQTATTARLENPASGKAKAMRQSKLSISNHSTILHDGEHWTIVPNGAVIHMPELQKAKVNVQPIGTLLPWTEFLVLNKSWIAINEVTFDQAAGNEALSSERAEFWKKQDKIVIAVHQNGPTAVQIGKGQALTSR
ncbi:MAG: hypothetical protein Q7R22_007290 [Verrucomicrobiota bacterium JB025]|nr:hypothetical protein [Verrucomicrobiota bacterium JB025]